MIFLQTADLHLAFLERSNSIGTGLRRPHGGHDRNFFCKRGVADHDLMFAWNFSTRRVDDEIDVAVFDAVEHVGPAFVKFENFLHFDFRFRQCLGRSARRNNSEAELHKFARHRNNGFLVAVFDANEDVAFFRQRRRCRHLRFRVGQAKIDIHSHHFASRLHFRTERDVSALIA